MQFCLGEAAAEAPFLVTPQIGETGNGSPGNTRCNIYEQHFTIESSRSTRRPPDYTAASICHALASARLPRWEKVMTFIDMNAFNFQHFSQQNTFATFSARLLASPTGSYVGVLVVAGWGDLVRSSRQHVRVSQQNPAGRLKRGQGVPRVQKRILISLQTAYYRYPKVFFRAATTCSLLVLSSQ